MSVFNFKNYAILDSETTGTSKSDQVIEISLLASDGRVLFNKLIKPTRKINWSAYNIHKISDDSLKDSPEWIDVHLDFEEALKKVDVVYIYNKPFDIRMLDQTYRAHGLVMPDFNSICAMKIVKKWLDSKNRISDGKVNLTHVCEILDIEHEDVDRHRALGDCILTDRVIKKISSFEFLNKEKDSSLKVELSTGIQSQEYMKEMISNSTRPGMSFSEWVSELDSNGIALEPLYFNPNQPVFNACSYSMANLVVSASKLGKGFTPKQIIEKGVLFDESKDLELLEALHVDSQLRHQKTALQKLNSNDSVNISVLIKNNSLLKTVFKVVQKVRCSGVVIQAEYESLLDMENPYSQLKLDLLEPKGILLRNLTIDGNCKIEFKYKGRFDKTPKAVILKNKGVVVSFDGDKCVNKLVSTLHSGLSKSLVSYFKGDIDSEILSVDQWFFDAFTGGEVGFVKRFTNGSFIDKCMLTPFLVSEID